MKYDDPLLREQLAGEYALGSLHGAARARFERLMADDPGLRRLVVEYQEDLTPLSLSAPDVIPPSRLRAALEQATKPTTRADTAPQKWWQRLGFWRSLATANGLIAAALVAVVAVGVLPQEDAESELVYVGVLSDAQSKPGVAVMAYNRPNRLEIAAKTPLPAESGKELRLWIRDRETDQPVFLAAIPADQTTFEIPDEPWKLLRRAKALVVSLNDVSEAQTAPGSQVLYEGVCVNLKKWAETP